MKSLEINLGKINDIKKTYYLIKLDDNYAYLENELLDDTFSADTNMISSYKLTVRSDSGIYPGTANEMKKSEYKDIVRELLNREIIKKIISPDGATAYIPGRNYNIEDTVSEAAAALGRKGGKVKSAAKARASRENGKLGGRPKMKT